MRWCFQNAAHPYADGVGERGAGESQKDGLLTAFKADEFLETLNKLNITVDLDSYKRILTDTYRLAVTYRLSSYDVSYLELALRKKLPLATLDNELIAACKVSGVTPPIASPNFLQRSLCLASLGATAF